MYTSFYLSNQTLVVVILVYFVALLLSIFYFPDTGATDGLINLASTFLALDLAARWASRRPISGKKAVNNQIATAPPASAAAPADSENNPQEGKTTETEEDAATQPNLGSEAGPYIQKILAAARGGDWQAAKVGLEDLTIVADSSTAMRLLSTMSENGLKLSVGCFNAVIRAYAREGSVDAAAHLIEEMAAQGTAPDENTLNPAIELLSRIGNSQGALRWLRLLRTSRVRLHVQCYAKLLHACGSNRADMINAQQLFENLERPHAGKVPEGGSALIYNRLVQAWANAGHARYAEYWLRQAVCAGYRVSDLSYAEIISAFNGDELQAEAKLWCKMNAIAARVLSRSSPKKE